MFFKDSFAEYSILFFLSQHIETIQYLLASMAAVEKSAVRLSSSIDGLSFFSCGSFLRPIFFCDFLQFHYDRGLYFFFYLVLQGLQGFLTLRIHNFYQFCKILSHYPVDYCYFFLISLLLEPQLDICWTFSLYLPFVSSPGFHIVCLFMSSRHSLVILNSLFNHI